MEEEEISYRYWLLYRWEWLEFLLDGTTCLSIDITSSLRPLLFLDVRQRILIIFRRFGTVCRFHLGPLNP